MKTHVGIVLLSFVSVGLAAPAETIKAEVGVSASERCPTGYATQNGGTSGGGKGSTVSVSSLSALNSALQGDSPKTIIITGPIHGAGRHKVGSNKSIIGRDKSAVLTGNGFWINKAKNVIIRNVKIVKVKASEGDAITVQGSKNVWIDHCDLSSDREHGKDYYDGLLDIVHGSDFVTVSNTHFHDHFKASLVGHSDKNEGEDKGHLHVTYYNNLWTNINSRAPSLRFGTGHIFNSVFNNVNDGINARQGANVLVQGNVFINVTRPLYSRDKGFAVQNNNDFGTGGKPQLEGGKMTNVPYKYDVHPVAQVRTQAKAAGNTLSFSGK
jgi:pectate lyase